MAARCAAAMVLVAATALSGGVASAAVASPPPGCPFTVSVTGFQGALGTLIVPLTLHPVSNVEECTISVPVSFAVVPSAGGRYSGILNNPLTATEEITFMPGRSDPSVIFGWGGYCASPAVPAVFVLQAGSQRVTEPYGVPQSCQAVGHSNSELNVQFLAPESQAVGLVPTTDAKGYTVALDNGKADPGNGKSPFDIGTVFGFGDATELVNLTNLAAPLVGVAASRAPGLWTVAADGGVFALEGAAFHGSASPFHPVAPIVGMAATPDGGGYWVVGADGGVFTYGDAPFLGSDS